MNKIQIRVLVVSVMASFVSFLDGSIVNVALPAIARSLGGGLTTQQWVVDAYLLTLGSLILVAGSLSDLYGRQNILRIGLIGFGVTSLLCAAAPNSLSLILARGLQGVAGAMLVPSSLALIISTFKGESEGRAIGSWTAWTGISYVIGPLLGGVLVDLLSWRFIFVINVLPIVITLWLMGKMKEEAERKDARVDWLGAIMCTLGLFGSIFALIEQPHFGWQNPSIYVPFIGGLAVLFGFVWVETLIDQPMLTFDLFKVRNFTVGNLATISIYAGLSVATFLVVIMLQQLGHYSALQSGLSLLPVTIIMFLLSPRFGSLAGKYGARLFMSAGPITAALGFLLLLRINGGAEYFSQVFPGVIVFGLGLSMTVAPLTATILGHIPVEHSGEGSAINNAIARIAGLVAIAAIGLIIGSKLDFNGFYRGIIAMSVLLAAGGLISAIGIQNLPVKRSTS